MSDQRNVHHADELDRSLASALETMLSQSPTDAQCDHADDRLRRAHIAGRTGRELSPARPVWRSLGATAAAALFCLMWLGAQTESWGEVVVDYKSSFSAENQPSTAADVIPASPTLRFVLMVHVFGLSVGLLGFAGTWFLSQLEWWSYVFRGKSGTRITRWARMALFCSLLLYAGGLIIGGIWAWQAWGSPWRWDPRESLALVTLGIAALWYGQLRSQEEVASAHPSHEHRRQAVAATVAFWLIVLIFLLAPIYAAEVHSYGSGQFTAVNMLSGVAAVNLVLVFGAGMARRSSE